MDPNLKALLNEKTSFFWGCAFMYAAFFLGAITCALTIGLSSLVNSMYEHMAVNWDKMAVVLGPISMLLGIAFSLCVVLFFWYPWGCETIDLVVNKAIKSQIRFNKEWGISEVE